MIIASFFTSGTSAQIATSDVVGGGSVDSPQPPPVVLPQKLQNSFIPATLFEPILANLGFQELAMASPSLSDSAFATWNGPTTVFAPSDASIQRCASCSVPRLLREHILPGLFSFDYLSKLAFGTKIETLNPGHCITVTTSSASSDLGGDNNSTKIFIGGVEITRPDMFNNGLIVVHGLQGFISPLSPFSCNVERMTALSFPQPDRLHHQQPFLPFAIMRLMLRDAMLRLRNNGFSIVSLALKVKYGELVNLNNMTIFALDDASIFSGSHSYVNNVRFHIVPNRILSIADLGTLPAGTFFPTLVQGESLVITTAGETPSLRINYVRIKIPDLMRNLKIVVHSIFLPFPHLNPAATTSYSDNFVGTAGESASKDSSANSENVQPGHAAENVFVVSRSCVAVNQEGCDAVAPTSSIAQPTVQIEDQHGL